ncbi:hypothetical protein [Sphingomonas sp. Root50]|nr:hypothetical protein [Sphingomonas sp. Root50]
MRSTQRVLSLAFANSVGFSATTAMALWITTIDRFLSVPVWWGSVVGSAQLGAAAVVNLAAPYLFRRMACEDLAKVAAGAAALCGVVMASSTNSWIFAAAAIGLGMALGLLLSGSNALLARSHSVQSNYATAQMCEVVFSSTFYVVAGSLLAMFGLRSVFGLLAVMALAVALLMHRLSIGTKSPRDAPDATHGGPNWRVPVAMLAFVTFFIGQGAFYQHQMAIGGQLGIGAIDMSRLMAIATVGGIMGAVTSKFVGVRYGVVAPLILTTCSLATILVFAVRTDSPILFALCAILVQALTMGTVPYVFAILAGLDPTGRLPSRGPALLLIGVAGGPLLAESFIRIGGYPLVGIVASVLVLLAGCLFVLGTWRQPSPATIGDMEMVVPPA